MTSTDSKFSVSQARDRFSELVNQAAFAGRITRVTRGRNHAEAAAIVPISLLEEYERLLDEQDARVAADRLAEIDTGKVQPLPMAQVHDTAST